MGTSAAVQPCHILHPKAFNLLAKIKRLKVMSTLTDNLCYRLGIGTGSGSRPDWSRICTTGGTALIMLMVTGNSAPAMLGV